MNLEEALEIVITKTRHVRFREICDDSNQDVGERDSMRKHVLEMAQSLVQQRSISIQPPSPVIDRRYAVARPHDLSREIVVSRFKENLDWLDQATDFVSIYDKGGGQSHGLTIPHAYTFLENKGREAGSMLMHIVQHYSTLAGLTIFVQGDGLLHDIDLLAKIRESWDKPIPLCRHYSPVFPPAKTKAADRVERENGWDIHWGNALDQEAPRADGRKGWFNFKAWAKVFTDPQPDPLWFGYAAQWAVPKSFIQHRPVGFWRWLLVEVLKAKNEKDVWDGDNPLTAWAVEALWNYLWDSEYHTLKPPPDTVGRSRNVPPRVPKKPCNCGGGMTTAERQKLYNELLANHKKRLEAKK